MTEKIIIGIIVLAALALTVYKVFMRPTCNCGCGGKKGKEKPCEYYGMEDE
ncbi:MAG: FeoB-associated Cys-rich membrane protein [Deltaproteobacteria bacterium]|jgi:hypothetical protein|nr:FeoB-associated Cys-rich membrane protein [Deltaproteobacteria bacterium]